MKILFYTVSNKRSRDIESQALLFSKSGHQVYLLTQNSRSELHDFFEQYGFQTGSIGYASSVLPFFIVVHIFYFLRFCNKNKINIAYSHLDSCSLISVLAQFFTSTRVVVCRHHADALIYETNWKGQWISKMIYKMARVIIAVSQNAKEFMVRNESISQNKISVIPLSFDFDLYPLPNKDEVNAIRNKFKADLLLITVGRFTSLKRIDHIIDLVNILHTQGADVKLFFLQENNS